METEEVAVVVMTVGRVAGAGGEGDPKPLFSVPAWPSSSVPLQAQVRGSGSSCHLHDCLGNLC